MGNSDPFGTWAEEYSKFKITENGFNVDENIKFLSRSFCLLYASDVVRKYGEWTWLGKKYKSMSPLRIAQEIWCHALVFYIGSPLKGVLLKIGISWSALNDIVKSGEYIEVNNDDNRVWIYNTLWYSIY